MAHVVGNKPMPKEYNFPDRAISGVSGTAIPKPANEQNTDDIAPARFLRWISFRPMGLIAFYDERHKNGKPVVDNPFNDPVYAGGSILIAGENFGTGSSREHAPQALKRFGIDAIIAESFADIFDGNCASVGIVPVTVDKKYIDMMINDVRSDPKVEFGISLHQKNLFWNGEGVEMGTCNYKIEEGTRQAFLRGYWDAMPLLQSNEAEIAKVEESLPYLKFK